MREILFTVFKVLSPSFIAAIVVNLVMPRIMPRLKKREKADDLKAAERHEVRIDKAIATFYKASVIFITVAVAVLTVVAIVLPYVSDEDDSIIMTFLILGGISIAATYLSTWFMLKRVEYNDEYFEYINALGLKKRFAYADVVSIKRTLGVIRVNTTGKSFILFKAFAGHAAFVAVVKEKNPNVTVSI